MTDLYEVNLDSYGIKKRHCPGCGELPKRFIITGIYSPIEQWRINDFDASYRVNEMSFTPLSNMFVQEFFIHYFRSVCNSCGLVSIWNLTPDEVSGLIKLSNENPASGYQIGWVYSEFNLRSFLEKSGNDPRVSQQMKDNVKGLIDLLYPSLPADQPS